MRGLLGLEALRDVRHTFALLSASGGVSRGVRNQELGGRAVEVQTADLDELYIPSQAKHFSIVHTHFPALTFDNFLCDWTYILPQSTGQTGIFYSTSALSGLEFCQFCQFICSAASKNCEYKWGVVPLNSHLRQIR